MNPYNLGLSRNCKEVFCSKIPSSRNNFRAKTKVNSSLGFSASSCSRQTVSPEMPKRSFDVEKGKRQGVDADDFEDIKNHVGTLGRLERCSTEPRHNDREQRGIWGISPDKTMFTSEFGTELCIRDREKVNDDC